MQYHKLHRYAVPQIAHICMHACMWSTKNLDTCTNNLNTCNKNFNMQNSLHTNTITSCKHTHTHTSATSISSRSTNLTLRLLFSNPSRGINTCSAVISKRTCSMLKTMALSRTSILPVSDATRLTSNNRMSRIGTPKSYF